MAAIFAGLVALEDHDGTLLEFKKLVYPLAHRIHASGQNSAQVWA